MAERALALTQIGRGDRYYTYTELLAISRRFKQNPNELMITWILRVYDQGGPALSLNSGELALLGDLTSDAIFNYHCKTLRGGCKTLLTWLLLAWRQRWESFLHFEATELPFRPWTTMEEGIQLVRELGMLDWIYREPPSPPAADQGPRPAPEDVPFTQGLQRRLLTAAPSELRLSLVSLLVKGMTVLEAVMEIQTIADVGLLWRQSQPGRAKLMLGPNPTRKDLMGWLLSHGVPKERVDKQPTKVLLELYIKEAKRSRSHPAYMLGEEQPPPPPTQTRPVGRNHLCPCVMTRPPRPGLPDGSIPGETQSEPVPPKHPQHGLRTGPSACSPASLGQTAPLLYQKKGNVLVSWPPYRCLQPEHWRPAS